MLSYAEIKHHVAGRFFRATFVKRTDGSVRVMHARLDVRKHLSGGQAKYSFSEKNLLSVWDLDARGYRCIPLDAIMELKCGPVSLTEDGRLARYQADLNEPLPAPESNSRVLPDVQAPARR